MVDYYVYYKVPEAVTQGAASDFLPVLIAMQSEVLRLCGVRGRLKKKAGDHVTWMEIYESVHQRLLFEATLADCVERFAFKRFLAEGAVRRNEVFSDPD